METWKDIPNYEGLYMISSIGRVKRLLKGTGRKRDFMTPTSSGLYPCLDLCKDGIVKRHTIHRLLATVFIPNPENKPQVNHLNGLKHDNRLENLEWCTQKENSYHAIEIGLHPISPGKVMTGERIEMVFSLKKQGFSQMKIADKLNVNQSVVSRVINKKGKYLINY